MRTFKVTIETVQDDGSTVQESISDNLSFELSTLHLMPLRDFLNKLARGLHEEPNIIKVLPHEPEGWEILDADISQGVDLGLPPGSVFMNLGDGRALSGLIKWCPKVECGKLVTVDLKTYMVVKKKETDAKKRS